MPTSLRTRLTVGVALVVLAAIALTFGVVYHTTGSQLRAQIDRSIRSSAIQLAHAMTEHPPTSSHALLVTARRYASAQPYSASAMLLFVILPEVGTATNHPELFGAGRREPEESASEQARENTEGRRLTRPQVGYSTKPAPDAGMLRLYQVRFRAGGTTGYAGAGESLAAVDHAQDVVAHSFALGGAVALAFAVLAAYLIGTRMTDPIRRSAAVAARVDAGDLTPRIELPPGTNSELLVLAHALNHMLERLATAFEAQREFVADASHELRTPLTVLRGQLEVLAAGDREDGSASPTELKRVESLMLGEIARLTRLVDDLLLLTQADRDDFLHTTEFALDELVREQWDGLSLIAERRFEIGTLEPLRVEGDPDRLAQAIRNLARNAITHTSAPSGLVRVELYRPGPGIARITVSDDGHGVPREARERVFERFYRTDRARTRADGGAGLGLAIVRAIADAHHGSVRVTDSAAGGAAFELDLPLLR